MTGRKLPKVLPRAPKCFSGYGDVISVNVIAPDTVIPFSVDVLFVPDDPDWALAEYEHFQKCREGFLKDGRRFLICFCRECSLAAQVKKVAKFLRGKNKAPPCGFSDWLPEVGVSLTMAPLFMKKGSTTNEPLPNLQVSVGKLDNVSFGTSSLRDGYVTLVWVEIFQGENVNTTASKITYKKFSKFNQAKIVVTGDLTLTGHGFFRERSRQLQFAPKAVLAPFRCVNDGHGETEFIPIEKKNTFRSVSGVPFFVGLTAKRPSQQCTSSESEQDAKPKTRSKFWKKARPCTATTATYDQNVQDGDVAIELIDEAEVLPLGPLNKDILARVIEQVNIGGEMLDLSLSAEHSPVAGCSFRSPSYCGYMDFEGEIPELPIPEFNFPPSDNVLSDFRQRFESSSPNPNNIHPGLRKYQDPNYDSFLSSYDDSNSVGKLFCEDDRAREMLIYPPENGDSPGVATRAPPQPSDDSVDELAIFLANFEARYGTPDEEVLEIPGPVVIEPAVQPDLVPGMEVMEVVRNEDTVPFIPELEKSLD